MKSNSSASRGKAPPKAIPKKKENLDSLIQELAGEEQNNSPLRSIKDSNQSIGGNDFKSNGFQVPAPY